MLLMFSSLLTDVLFQVESGSPTSLVGGAISFMVISKSEKSLTAFVDYVSIYPSAAWLELALACVGLGSAMSADVQHVRQLLTSDDLPLAPSLDLATSVDDLFGERAIGGKDSNDADVGRSIGDANQPDASILPSQTRREQADVVLSYIVDVLRSSNSHRKLIASIRVHLYRRFGRCQVRHVVGASFEKFVRANNRAWRLHVDTDGWVSFDARLTTPELVQAMVALVYRLGGERKRVPISRLATELQHDTALADESLRRAVGGSSTWSIAQLVQVFVSKHAREQLISLPNGIIADPRGIDVDDIVATCDSALHLFKNERAAWPALAEVVARTLRLTPRDMRHFFGDETSEEVYAFFYAHDHKRLIYFNVATKEAVRSERMLPSDALFDIASLLSEHGGLMPSEELVRELTVDWGAERVSNSFSAAASKSASTTANAIHSSLKAMIDTHGGGRVRWLKGDLVALPVAPDVVVEHLKEELMSNGASMTEAGAFAAVSAKLHPERVHDALGGASRKEFLEAHARGSIVRVPHEGCVWIALSADGVSPLVALVATTPIAKPVQQQAVRATAPTVSAPPATLPVPTSLAATPILATSESAGEMEMERRVVARVTSILFASGGQIGVSVLFSQLHLEFGAPVVKRVTAGQKAKAWVQSKGGDSFELCGSSPDLVQLTEPLMCVNTMRAVLESNGGRMSASALVVSLYVLHANHGKMCAINSL
jgi:hypothetical protein